MKLRCALLALLLSTLSAASFAQELRAPDSLASTHETTDEQSQAAFEAGASHYERGNFQAATAAFRKAHELSPQPALLYNLAQAERLDGQCGLALAHYEQFVAAYTGAGPKDIDDKIAASGDAQRCDYRALPSSVLQ